MLKNFIIVPIVILSACTSDRELLAHLDAEQDFHKNSVYIEDLYEKYEPEYVDDCLYYEDLICEFE